MSSNDISSNVITSNVIINYRGYTEDEIRNDVELGEYEEARFKMYMMNKFGIELEKQDRLDVYDFVYTNNRDIMIEYKALQLKPPKYVDDDGNVKYYDEIMIGSNKIEHFYQIYRSGLKKNKLYQFYYIICFWWYKKGVIHRVYKYCYLDLNFIKNFSREFEYRNKKHFMLNFKWFRNLSGFQMIINHQN